MSGSITALVRVLVEGGASPQLILAAVEQAELAKDNALDRSREKARNRIKKWREKQTCNVTERSVTVTKRLARVEDSSSRLDIPGKEERKDDASPSAQPKTKATRNPETFVPDEAWAVDQGMTPAQARIEAAQFIDFWRGKPGKDGTKADWPATWRMWVRNAIKRQPAVRSGAPPPRNGGNVIDAMNEIFRERGWATTDEPTQFSGDFGHDQRLSAVGGGKEGVIVDLREGAWRRT